MARNKKSEPPVILADGCYVPEHLVFEGDVRSLYDKVFFYSELACSECEKLDDRPRRCGGCDNFQGHYPLCAKRKLDGVVYWRLPRDAFWRLNTNFSIDLHHYPWEDWRSQTPFSPEFDRLWKFHWHMLRPEQLDTVNKYLDLCWTSGLRGAMAAAPRTGKTVMSLALIRAFGFRTLILANIVDLLRNFRADAEIFTNLLEVEEQLGRTCMAVADSPEQFHSLDIVMMTPNAFYERSWGSRLLVEGKDAFGACHIDELHRTGSKQFNRIVDNFNVFNRTGVTATYKRKDNKHSVTRETTGPIMVVAEGDSLVPRVIVHDLREVSDCTPDRQDPKGYYYNKACQADLEINRALVANVRKDVSEGRKVIITVLYLNHVTQLVKFFKALGMTVGIFIGQGSRPPALKGCERDRAKVVKLAGEGAFDVVVGIRSIIGTGVNVKPWSSLHVVVNTSNEYNMYQETKRVCTPLEGKPQPLLHFYLDASHKTASHLGNLYRTLFLPYGYLMDEETEELLKTCQKARNKSASEYRERMIYERMVSGEAPPTTGRRSLFSPDAVETPKKKKKLSVKAVTNKAESNTLETPQDSPVGNGLNW